MKQQNRNILRSLVLLTFVGLMSVSAQNDDSLLPQNQPQPIHPSLTRARRMYALCPPDFQKVGNECYFMSKKKESWLDAHFECKDRNSKLAEPLKYADRRLRKFLKNHRDQTKEDRWIGGMYNWQRNQWQWGYNGGEMKYHSFGSHGIDNTDLHYRCTTYDPALDYMWSAKKCTERHFFICQHRMRYVNSRNRQEIYSKWNETYPNKLANEVEVYLSTNGNNNRSYYRAVPKKQLRQHVRPIQLNNQTPKTKEIQTSPPDYLPYNLYKNLQPMQKPNEDQIHPIDNSHGENPNTPAMKPKKRHSKLKLTGEVDLGKDRFKMRNERRKKKKKQPVEVSDKKNEVLVENVSDKKNEVIEEVTKPKQQFKEPFNTVQTDVTMDSDRVVFITSTHRPTFRLEFETSEQPLEERTLRPSTTTSSDQKKKMDEKALRRQRLIQKLKALTPEERQAFLLMKQQRAEAKKKGLQFGH